MRIEFLEPAHLELDEAVAFYNKERADLGKAFAVEVQRALERIVAFPEAWHKLSNQSRRCLLRRFPYGIVYQRREDLILVVAVMHLHRAPESWQSRLGSQEE